MDRKDLIGGVITSALFVGAFGSFCMWRAEVNKPAHTASEAAAIIGAREDAEQESLESEIESEKLVDYLCKPTYPSFEYVPTTCEIEPYYTEIYSTEESTVEETESNTEPTDETITTVAETTTIQETVPAVALQLTDEEKTLLIKTASCEAGGQGIVGIALVMRVIINRSILYGCSIRDVIYAPNQFAVVGNELWNADYMVLDAFVAVELIQNGWDESNGATYFCTPNHNTWHRQALTYLYTYQDHEFYK